MTVDDFKKQPRGSYSFDAWLSKRAVASPMGDFDAELREPPDAELVAEVNAQAEFLRSNIGEVWDMVHQHYQRAAKHLDWMESCGVPAGLTRDGILQYIRSRAIIVERDDGAVDGVIFLDPLWDIEHKIFLRREDGVLEFSDW